MYTKYLMKRVSPIKQMMSLCHLFTNSLFHIDKQNSIKCAQNGYCGNEERERERVSPMIPTSVLFSQMTQENKYTTLIIFFDLTIGQTFCPN